MSANNPWLIHINNFRLENPEMSYRDVLIEARKTYTPIRESGKKSISDNKVIKQTKEEKKEIRLTKKVLDKIHKEIDDDFNNMSLKENKPVKKSNRKQQVVVVKQEQ